MHLVKVELILSRLCCLTGPGCLFSSICSIATGGADGRWLFLTCQFQTRCTLYAWDRRACAVCRQPSSHDDTWTRWPRHLKVRLDSLAFRIGSWHVCAFLDGEYWRHILLMASCLLGSGHDVLWTRERRIATLVLVGLVPVNT